MISLISDNIFKSVINEVGDDLLERAQIDSSLIDNYLNKYLLLKKYPDKFSNDYTPLDIYYNKYFWYLKFSTLHNELNGYDAGVEQQEFKIIEEGENYSDIDWSVVEKISSDIKNR